MKILVTGGAGFIGSHLVDALIKRGDKVIVIDNLSTGKKENLNPKAGFFKKDIRDFKGLKPLFKGVDFVFHLAALPRVQLSINDPIGTNEINALGTVNVLEAARRGGVKRVIFASSSSIYGDPKKIPTKEEIGANPMSPYGLQKYIGELYCGIYSFLYGLETVSLRYFNVYGPRMAEEGAYALVTAIFLRQKREGKPLTITGMGENSRAYTHVFDVVRANLLAQKSKKAGRGEAINIGGRKDYSVNYIAKLFGGPVKYIAPRLEPKKTLPDVSLAKKLLGWEPKIKFEEGMRELIASELT